MRCVRCGYCCIEPMIIIVDDPDKGVIEGNLILKKPGERCKHLRGDKPGGYSCVVHDKEWYKDTPCAAYGQIEQSPDCVCRTGEYMLKQEKQQQKK